TPRPDVELARPRQRTDHHRLEARVPDELLCNGQRLRIIPGQRDGVRLTPAVRLAAEVPGVDGVEGTHQAHARQVARRGHPGTLAARLQRHGTVAFWIRIAGIEHDLAGELLL